MRNVTVAAVQMKCSKSVEKNIAHAEELVRQAAAKGAEIVLLPELFERPYFSRSADMSIMNMRRLQRKTLQCVISAG